MELEKIEISIEKDTPYVTKVNGVYEIFEGVDLESGTITKEEIAEIAEKYGTNSRDIVLESLYKADITDLTQPQYFMLNDVLRNIDQIDFANGGATTNLLKSYIERERSETMERIRLAKDKQTKFLDEFKKNKPVPTTEFIQDSKEVRKIYERVDPHELFNSIETSENIPFAYLKYNNDPDVYKIYESAKISIEDLKLADLDSPVHIIMYYKDSPVYINFINNTVDISFEVSLKDINAENFILGSIKEDLVLIETKKEGIRGNFAISDFDINRELFLDLIMNDPIVSKIFSVDESRKVGSGSKKDDNDLRSIYLSYEPEKGDQVNVFISQKTSGRSDPFVVKKYVPLFSDYLSIRMSKIDSLEKVDKYRELLGQLMGIYNAKYDTIRKEYARILPRFKSVGKTVKTNEESKLKQLQRRAPEIFIQDYSKLSEKKYQPILYDEGNPVHSNLEIMTFEGIELVCPIKYPYPGLKKSSLNNKDRYPYMPSCYETKTEPYNLWKRYEAGKEIDIEKSIKTTSKKVQKKALKEGQHGLLPRNIYFLLGRNDDYYRAGTPFDNNSFIHAVLQAVDKKYLQSKNKKVYASNIRRGFAANPRQEVVQQLWDKTQSDIEKELLDENIQFDSKLFIGYLQSQYNIKIYVFSSLEDINGSYEIPRYTQGYLSGDYDKSVMVYKHFGSEGQNLKFPHYELIRSDDKAVFRNSKKLMTKIEKYYNKCYNLHSLGIRTSKDIEFDSQIVDDYGKSRILLFNDYKITMWISPQSPENNPGLQSNIFTPTDLSNVEKFVEEKGLRIISKNIENGKLIGVKTNAFEYSYIDVVPTDDTLDDIPADGYSLQSGNSNDNILRRTFDNRKIANFMTQFMLYQFSLFLEKNDYEPSNEDLQTFLLNKKKYYNKMLKKYVKSFMVKPDNDFLSNVPRQFTLNNSFFDNDFLIVDSEETARKLQWVLYYYVNTEINTVLDYKNRKYLEDYYILPEDYKQWPNTTILIGEKSLEDWIFMEHIDYRTVDIPVNTTVKPQFWISWVIGKGLNIVQNSKNLKEAVYISDTYMRESYNIGYDMDIPETYEIPDYNEITMKNGVLIVKNLDKSIPTVYKYDENSFAAVLMTGY
jgi:hypothetical protein